MMLPLQIHIFNAMTKKKTKENKRRIFVTSDLWIGRNNVIDIFNRPFKNVSEMNNVIIERWNTTVGDDDIVFILGNFIYSGTRAQNFVTDLKGFKVLMATENDKRVFQIDSKLMDEVVTTSDNMYVDTLLKFYDNVGVVSDCDVFDGIINISEKVMPEIIILRSGVFEISQYGIVLSNYAMLDWNCKDKGSINIHGGMVDTSADIANDSRVNVRTDLWDFTPVNIFDIKKVVEMKRKGGLV